ncbi:amidase [Microbacterium indicum]|uniref:amidase n=1 Tax=Microbacterium indicum TaxID=358100 RepID=UPI000A00D0D1|nr:amidase [Microbacterium indicum]
MHHRPSPLSVAETAKALRSGTATARAVVEDAIERADALDGPIGSLVWRDDDASRRAADAWDAAADAPLLAGVPVTVKDTFQIAGQPWRRASEAISDRPADETDLLPAAAFRAGLVQVGRAASPELAMTTSCESPLYGATRNPWDLKRSPGGSSGGPAAAVAAGIVPAALASDGGGSLRVPAAFCGLVGLKPGRGALPQRVQGWEGGSTEGVVTRDVRDTAILVRELSAPDPHGWAPPRGERIDAVADLEHAPDGMRIGLLTEAFDPAIPVDPEVAAAVEETAGVLRSLGHDVVRIPAPAAGAELMDIYPSVIIPAWLQQTALDEPERLQPYIRRVMAQADGLSAADYVRASIRTRRLARSASEEMFGALDAVLTPTSATRVPRIGVVLAELTANAPSRTSAVYEQTLAFTTVASMIGAPALTLPTHVDSDGLPIGSQLIGPQRSEELLLRLGRSLERHYAWDDRYPDVPADGM